MVLRGLIPCVFLLAINVDRPEQYADRLRSLQAVYRRFCQEQGLARAFCAKNALYAKPANALPSKVFSEVVDLASGDVVQLVRTLPCHGRGRGFESRRPRHSYQTTCADFGETIEDPKGHVFAPFLVSLFAVARFALVLTRQRLLIPTIVTFHLFRTKTPTTRRLPELHVWPA